MNPLDVKCPVCQAYPGERCSYQGPGRRKTVTRAWFTHVGRNDLAAELAEAG